MGWIRQDSLAGTHVPYNGLTINTRNRAARTALPVPQRSFIHMQAPSASTTDDLTPGAWEYGVPNGRYTVTVNVGDQPGGAKTGCADPCYDSQHSVRVEGVTAIDRFRATAAAEYKSGSVTVDVIDGKLTVDAIGANTKLNRIEIVSAGPVTPDTTTPGLPTGLTGTAGDASVTLSWTAPADTDVAVTTSIARQPCPWQ